MTSPRRAEAASHIFDVMTIARAFGPKFGQAAGFVHRAIRMRQGRARLHAMPDHMLKDMGIARCEISSSTRFRKAASAEWLRPSGE
ncbi:DUF1127 domain-containing protein [Mesorhizobium sp. IMUNJ 23232]|uniref:DUF1127 domain-containing protein n=1 Tax=Mesorhizobium sp. IMUNJ 23232 TaxID=3376064 RepID=UPI00378BF584